MITLVLAFKSMLVASIVLLSLAVACLLSLAIIWGLYNMFHELISMFIRNHGGIDRFDPVGIYEGQNKKQYRNFEVLFVNRENIIGKKEKGNTDFFDIFIKLSALFLTALSGTFVTSLTITPNPYSQIANLLATIGTSLTLLALAFMIRSLKKAPDEIRLPLQKQVLGEKDAFTVNRIKRMLNGTAFLFTLVAVVFICHVAIAETCMFIACYLNMLEAAVEKLEAPAKNKEGLYKLDNDLSELKKRTDYIFYGDTSETVKLNKAIERFDVQLDLLNEAGLVKKTALTNYDKITRVLSKLLKVTEDRFLLHRLFAKASYDDMSLAELTLMRDVLQNMLALSSELDSSSRELDTVIDQEGNKLRRLAIQKGLTFYLDDEDTAKYYLSILHKN